MTEITTPRSHPFDQALPLYHLKPPSIMWNRCMQLATDYGQDGRTNAVQGSYSYERPRASTTILELLNSPAYLHWRINHHNNGQYMQHFFDKHKVI